MFCVNGISTTVQRLLRYCWPLFKIYFQQTCKIVKGQTVICQLLADIFVWIRILKLVPGVRIRPHFLLVIGKILRSLRFKRNKCPRFFLSLICGLPPWPRKGGGGINKNMYSHNHSSLISELGTCTPQLWRQSDTVLRRNICRKPSSGSDTSLAGRWFEDPDYLDVYRYPYKFSLVFIFKLSQLTVPYFSDKTTRFLMEYQYRYPCKIK